MTDRVAPAVAVPPLLSVRGLSKTFPGQRALVDVDLDVHPGEILAVVGQNGSGKSTLVKVLSGVHPPDPGALITVRRRSPITGEVQETSDPDVHVIHQDLGLIPMLSAVENLDLGRIAARRAALPFRRRAERAHARGLLAQLGVSIDVDIPVENLSPAERTMVAIARALDGWAAPDRVLLLDEPTASLHESETLCLFDAARQLAARGAGIVFISHRLGEVLSFASRVVALRGGRVVADTPTDTIDRGQLVRMIVGREVVSSARPAGGSHEASGYRNAPGTSSGPSAESTRAPRLSVTGLSGPGVVELDVDVRAGEIVGVCGLVGSGRERLCSLLFGGDRPDAGLVRVDGSPVRQGSPRAAVAAGMALVPADRHGHGAVMTMRARENLTLAELHSLRTPWRTLSPRRERREADRWFADVELDPLLPERDVEQFSGGNQQKIVLARWLRTSPRVLLLDEPTQGVDVGARAAIYDLVRGAAKDGCAVLVCSSDTAELAEICQRVIVMREGRVGAELIGDDITDARLVAASQRAAEVVPAPPMDLSSRKVAHAD